MIPLTRGDPMTPEILIRTQSSRGCPRTLHETLNTGFSEKVILVSANICNKGVSVLNYTDLFLFVIVSYGECSIFFWCK